MARGRKCQRGLSFLFLQVITCPAPLTQTCTPAHVISHTPPMHISALSSFGSLEFALFSRFRLLLLLSLILSGHGSQKRDLDGDEIDGEPKMQHSVVLPSQPPQSLPVATCLMQFHISWLQDVLSVCHIISLAFLGLVYCDNALCYFGDRAR